MNYKELAKVFVTAMVYAINKGFISKEKFMESINIAYSNRNSDYAERALSAGKQLIKGEKHHDN